MIYVDGAITVESAKSFLDGVKPHLKPPTVSIVGVPVDRNFGGVYEVMAQVSKSLIITETNINPNTHFPSQEDAIATAQQVCDDVHYTKDLPEALDIAKIKVGVDGTILLVVSLMLVGECMLIWEIDTSII